MWGWLKPLGAFLAKTLATAAVEKLTEGLTGGAPTSAPAAAPMPVTSTPRKRRPAATAVRRPSR